MSKWDRSADLVVVGFGAAGAAAAITGADAGSDVVILEKQPAEWHTPSTRGSGGQVTAVGDPAAALPYFDRCAGGMVPLAVSRAWVERANTVIGWLENVVGIKMVQVVPAEHPEWPGSETVGGWGAEESYPYGLRTMEMRLSIGKDRQEGRRGGAALFAALEAAVAKRSRVSVRYEHVAKRLVTDENGRVIGVEASTPTGPIRVEARRGVILTCGGYEWDDEMKLGYLRAGPVHFYGSPMNTGDGVRMAQAVGADLWHMNSMTGRAVAHFELDGKSYNYMVMISGGAGYVLADKYGRRFANEHMQAMSRHDFYFELINYNAATGEYPKIPCYWLFDSRRMHVPLLGGTGASGPNLHTWRDNVEEEMVERGWLFRGDSFADVAARAGIVDSAAAARTIAEYNEACRTKQDPFDRPPESLVPLDKPPFYCMPLWPGGPNTSGGPRKNEWSQIINVFGEPIPGLYEAGELGEAVGALYPANGGNISDALCFGQIAAEHALGHSSSTSSAKSRRG